MRSSALGKNTSAAEVQDISRHGLWLLVGQKEYFLPYKDYPWFREAKVSEIYNVELLHKKHLHWPALDVDLEIQSLQNSGQYPLIYK